MNRLLFSIAVLLLFTVGTTSHADNKLIIADSAMPPLPHGSLSSLALVIAMGADIVRLEAAMTSDDHVIVVGDNYLRGHTDIEERYIDRARSDGSFHTLDFSLEEIKRLSLLPEADQVDGAAGIGYTVPALSIATLPEVLGLIRIFEQKLGRPIGLVIELKQCWFHLKEGKDLARGVVDVLSTYGTGDGGPLYLAAYDAEQLQRLHDTLQPEAGMESNLMQLIDHDRDGLETMRLDLGQWLPYDYGWMLTKFGLKALYAYADVIGLPPEILEDTPGEWQLGQYVDDAHTLGLKVIAYPFEPFAESAGVASDSDESQLEYLLFNIGLDGLYTGHYELVDSYLQQRATPPPEPISPQQQSINRLIENAERSLIPREDHSQPLIPLN